MVMQRTVRLPKCGVQMFNYFTLDATVPPRRSPAGVRSFDLPRFGRLSHPCVASNSIPSSILDAPHFHTWRPIPSHPLFWTPCPSLSGVHPSNFLNFGRLSRPCMASNSIPSSTLDAMAFSCWRPSFQLSQFWTPVTSMHSVQFHPILSSGRHVHHSLASILSTFSILDAFHFHAWRPILSLPQFWTPLTSIRGVHFHLILSSGRHAHHSLASILSALSLLKPFNASENSNRSSTS